MKGEPRKITGRTVLIVAVSAFAVVLAANLTLLYAATGSFPGLVVKNSYVAGIGWDDRTRAQRALGWHASVGHADGTLSIRLIDDDGRPVDDLAVEATVRRPAQAGADHEVRLSQGAEGAYRAPLVLAPGQWRVELRAGGPGLTEPYRASALVHVRTPG